MKSTEQTGCEYLAGLNKQIEAMAPIERACSMATVNLGNVLAALITRHDWKAVESMRESCSELFTQAAQIEYEEKRRKPQ